MSKHTRYYGFKGNGKIILVIPWGEKEPPTTEYFFENYDIFGSGSYEVVEVKVKQVRTIK